MKSTVMDESLSTNATRVLFHRKLLYFFKRQHNEKPTPNENSCGAIGKHSAQSVCVHTRVRPYELPLWPHRPLAVSFILLYKCIVTLGNQR